MSAIWKISFLSIKVDTGEIISKIPFFSSIPSKKTSFGKMEHVFGKIEQNRLSNIKISKTLGTFRF